MKYYAIENDGQVLIRMCRDKDSLPKNAIEISKENFDKAVKIPGRYDKKIVGNQVVEKTAEEKELANTEHYGERLRGMIDYKASRTSYRMTRLPLDFKGTKVKFEFGDLRATPHGLLQTWDNFLRDAILCDLTGNSVLPIKVWTENGSLEITNSKDLYDLHKAFTERNKEILEAELDIKSTLAEKETFSEITAVHLLNKERS
jgi:hypothetical protein